jgi:hypothetical protein
MPHLFKKISSLTVKVYHSTENAVIGRALQSIYDCKEYCRLKLIFDYTFFSIILILPKFVIDLYNQNTTNLLLLPVLLGLLITGLLMLKQGVSHKTVAVTVALATLIVSMLSSLFNNQETTLKYAMIWACSILFCYLATDMGTTLILGFMLCSYLVLASWMRIHHITIYTTPGYSSDQNRTFMPLIMAFYILFLIRVFGRHYDNILRFEHEKYMQRQKQHSALLNQHLTKQFIILKGLSRSGQSKHLNGNREFLEACLIEIEKQCESAIDYLDNAHLREAGLNHMKELESEKGERTAAL